MAAALVEAGCDVCITGHDPARLREAEDRLRAGAGGSNGCIRAELLDVRSEEAIDVTVRRLIDDWGRIDVLMNNAGIGMRTVNPLFSIEPKPFWTVPPSGFRTVMETNVIGYFLMARAVVPHMVTRGFGKVVNVTINRSTMTRRGFVPYGPSRAASEAFSEIMTHDLAESAVSVNLLLPGGGTLTGMIPEEVRPRLAQDLLGPEIMGPPAVWLVSRESDGITGERITASTFEAYLSRWREEKGGSVSRDA